MPNWCMNSVTFIFPSEKLLDEFIDAIKKEKLFSTFVPVNTLEEQVKKWGTKWEPTDVEINIDDVEFRKLYVSYATAWSPPINFYETIYREYGIETCSYFSEGGQEFFGESHHSLEGVVLDYYNYPTDAKSLMEINGVITNELRQYMEGEWDEEWVMELEN